MYNKLNIFELYITFRVSSIIKPKFLIRYIKPFSLLARLPQQTKMKKEDTLVHHFILKFSLVELFVASFLNLRQFGSSGNSLEAPYFQNPLQEDFLRNIDFVII